MFKIYPILNSQGDLVLEIAAKDNTDLIVASVPVGTSVGSKEVVSLDLTSSVESINRYKLLKFLKDKLTDFVTPKEFDEALIELDPTPNKQYIGGNITLLFSVFYAKLYARLTGLPLYKSLNQIYSSPLFNPRLSDTLVLFNFVNGGKHGNPSLVFQEFKVAFLGTRSILEQAQKASEFNNRIKQILRERLGFVSVGLEGGYTFPGNISTALDLIMQVAESLSLIPQKEFVIFIDAAAGEFATSSQGAVAYHVGENILTSDQLIDFYLQLIQKYPIKGIEDPFAEDDIDAWKRLAAQTSSRGIVITGDDITATNSVFISDFARANVINNVIIKPNQVGTLLETYQAIHVAQNAGITVTVSHRSRETNDNFLSHIIASCNPTYIKVGNVVRGERVGKINELIRIENQLYD